MSETILRLAYISWAMAHIEDSVDSKLAREMLLAERVLAARSDREADILRGFVAALRNTPGGTSAGYPLTT